MDLSVPVGLGGFGVSEELDELDELEEIEGLNKSSILSMLRFSKLKFEFGLVLFSSLF